MALGNGYMGSIKQGFFLAIGASVALGIIKIIADATGGLIPRGFVLAQAGETMNTLNYEGEGRYGLS